MLFSIIIPTFNRAKLIQPTLDSILAQTYDQWECIVVDDGSTDHTGEVIQKYTAKDERFRYVYQENAERSAARNNGIKNARGQWICFLDSDDLYEQNYLSELITKLDQINNEPSLIISDYFRWNSQQKEEQPHPIPDKDRIADWLFQFPVSPTRCCVHAAILKIYQFDERICIVEDTVLWVSIASLYPIHLLNKPVVTYRVHEENSVAELSGSIVQRYEGLNLFFREPMSRGVSLKVKKQMLSEAEFRLAELYKSRKKNTRAAFYALKSLITQWHHEQRKMRFFFILNLLPGFSFVWEKFKQ
jgi:teichuronic acid biosynthesis glycosyltransferase TuaG